MSLGKRIQGEGHHPIIGGGGISSRRRVCRKINSLSTRKHRHLHRRTKAVSSILRSSDSKYSKNSSSSLNGEESAAELFEPPKYPLSTVSPNRQTYFVSARTRTTISNIPKQPDCRCCDCSCNDDDSNSSSTSWSSSSSSSSSVDSCGSSSISTATSEVVTSPITTTPSSRKRCDKTTRFYNKVAVVRIPSRHTYPSDMKRTMWSSMKEIYANAKRNTIEFASDGWDWRNATEENEFYQNPASGESVHPIHIVMHRRRRKRQQLQQQQQRRQLLEREAAEAVKQHCS